MKNDQARSWRLAGALLMLGASAALSAPIDLSKLPMLSPGDISITNNLDAVFSLVVEPQGCAARGLQIPVGETVHVRCDGATSVRANIATKTSKGELLERSRVVPASAHYTVGIDADGSFKLLDVRYPGR